MDKTFAKKAFLYPLMVLVIFTPFSIFLDKEIIDYFFKNGHFISNPFVNFFFDYGPMPAWILLGFAFFGLVASFFVHFLKAWRLPCFYIIATLAVGSGLIVHALLKDHWGRPRPKQVIEYGGQQAFRAYYQPNFFHQPEPSKSFPCGHCSTGFYFFCLTILGMHYHKKWLYWTGLFLSLFLGVTLSFTRMAQGGHFLSDTLVGGLLMWWTAIGLYFLLFKWKCRIKY